MTVIVETTERIIIRETPGNRVVRVVEEVDRVTVQTPGTRGEQGATGPSAYDLAVANGFVGTEQEWLDSLQGAGSTATLGFEANVALESDVWGPFVHNLGFVPSVTLYGNDGRQITGRIVENTTISTTVEFYLPVAGRITMS